MKTTYPMDSKHSQYSDLKMDLVVDSFLEEVVVQWAGGDSVPMPLRHYR